MQIHNLIQGSPEWHAYRAQHFNASDAPAMMGVSPYKSRSELLKERATGLAKEIDVATQALFDDGHRFEALARDLAENIVGEDLYPVTGSLDGLSASFDGLTMSEDVVFEHKTINNEIRSAACAEDLGEHYRIQMEQQLLISGAEKCLFLASKWDEHGELIEEKHFWYSPDENLRARIIAGWGQFKKDLTAYQHVEIIEKPKAEAIMQLPALAIHIRGEVAHSNLPAFKAAADQFIASIKTELNTDEDFAQAEATVKFCEKAEKDLELTKSAAIAQTASIDELMRTIDHIKDQLRNKRLTLDKLVVKQKDAIKLEILNKAKAAFADHIAALDAEIAPIRLQCVQPDFAGAMKNKRTLASLHDAVDTALANAKIDADAIAKNVRGNLAWFKEHAKDHVFLFSDLQSIIGRGDAEYFQMIVKNRIDDHKQKESARLEAERARIADEERKKAEAAATETLRREREAMEARTQAVLVAAQEQRMTENCGMTGPKPQPGTLSPIAPSLAPTATDATVNLGQINEMLDGVKIDAMFLEWKGFIPRKEGVARLYREDNLMAICDTIINHVEAVKASLMHKAAA